MSSRLLENSGKKLIDLVIVASTSIILVQDTVHGKKDSLMSLNESQVGSNPYLNGLQYIGTQTFKKVSPDKHTEIITKVSAYYNESARYIVYCMYTMVDAMNGANIEAGKTAIRSGSTIFQSMFNPGTEFTHTTWVRICHWKLLFGHWIKVCNVVPETSYSIDQGNLIPNVDGPTFSPNKYSHGVQIGSQTCSYGLSVGGKICGVSVSGEIGFSKTTDYYSSKIYVIGVHSQNIQWKKDDCVKGLTYTHFITIASTFYKKGGSPFIYLESIANTTYNFREFWGLAYSTLEVNYQYFPFDGSN
ncbi:MAG: hypothetical protein M1496_05735 [Candidatus Thermoplasmatota archaeon]|jgi:hypothetical protein|nr:hypothetical protein [Candidatus Thermoplasmatota archaeon]